MSLLAAQMQLLLVPPCNGGRGGQSPPSTQGQQPVTGQLSPGGEGGKQGEKRG